MVYRKIAPQANKTSAKSEGGVKAPVDCRQSANANNAKRADNVAGAGLSIPEVQMPPKETEASKKLLRQKIFADLAKIL